MDLATVARRRLDRVLSHARSDLGDVLNAPIVLPFDDGTGRPPLRSRLAERSAGVRVQFADPRRWPAGLPLPLTVSAALAALSAGRAELAAEIAAEIERLARELVEPERVEAVLERLAASHGGPWPFPPPREWSPAATALGAVLDACRTPPPGEPMRGGFPHADYWPASAEPIEVARWARVRLNAAELAAYEASPLAPLRRSMALPVRPTDEEPLGDRVVAWLSDTDTGPAGWPGWAIHVEPGSAPGSARYERRYPGAGVALVYLAARAVEAVTPASPMMIPLDVGRPKSRTTGALSGAVVAERDESPARVGRSRGDRGNDAPVQIRFDWDDGSETQLELPLWEDPSHPLAAIGKRYGGAAIRDIMAIEALTWASRRGTGESVWWWPSEHLELCSLGPDARPALLARMDRLTRTRLEVAYPNGRKLRGPLVTRSMEATDTGRGDTAWRLHLHPAIVREALGDEPGELGSYWWAIPIEVLRLPAEKEAGRVHAFAVLAGRLFRAGLNERRTSDPLLRIGAATLAERLGIEGRSRAVGSADDRAAAALRRTLEAARRVDLIGAWRVERGSLDDLTGTIVAHPGERSSRLLAAGELPRPAWIPATGAELDRWMARAGLSPSDLASRLGVSRPTVYNATATPELPLTVGLRSALRRWLWPDLTPHVRGAGV